MVTEYSIIVGTNAIRVLFERHGDDLFPTKTLKEQCLESPGRLEHMISLEDFLEEQEQGQGDGKTG